ncbi:MAG: NAD(P)/FAD-dependent oxidoreductase [Caldimonas sp.]
MIRLTELRLPLEHSAADLRAAIVARLGVDDADLRGFSVFRRGHDARKKARIVAVYTIDCDVADAAAVLERHRADRQVRETPDMRYRPVAEAPVDFRTRGRPRPVVVGFGPCGIFAALILAQGGFAPIVLERGRAVRERTQDTWGLWRRGVLDPESNVQFGEGGAGTFSDGKLWSQISDPRHLTRKVLDELVRAGAPEEILWNAKPHIGTFRLVGVVERMRREIERLGGEIRFGTRVVDLVIEDGAVRGVVVARAAAAGVARGDRDGTAGVVQEGDDEGAAGSVREEIGVEHVVLAPGHSARDTFAMLHARGVHVEAKPFSIGVRIEHPQSLIDRARYGPAAGHPLLGAADYRLVHHAGNGRSVYSFCMCPGGTVVAATSETERVVTNGMSQYSRNERNANAGIVVAVAPPDYGVPGAPAQEGGDPLAGIAFQRFWESRAFELGGGGYRAPGQRVGDFLRGQSSSAFGSVEPSYRPGVSPVDLAATERAALPAYAIEAIREALPAFEHQLPGFTLADAVLTGVETRTSSPLRLTRGRGRQSVNVRGLYPAGEGAGYAGGIMSAAVDGIEAAEAVAVAILT